MTPTSPSDSIPTLNGRAKRSACAWIELVSSDIQRVVKRTTECIPGEAQPPNNDKMHTSHHSLHAMSIPVKFCDEENQQQCNVENEQTTYVVDADPVANGLAIDGCPIGTSAPVVDEHEPILDSARGWVQQ